MRIKKELPLEIKENLCHLYLNYQNINSICFNNKIYKNLFFSNYLNCYSSNFEFYKFQYIPDDRMLYSGRFFETRIVDSTIFNSVLTRDEILQFILNSLNNDYYIDVYVDEYNLPGTLYYNDEHFPHEQLIYGYDLLNKELKFLSINKNGQTVKLNAKFDLFIDAMWVLQDDFYKQFLFDNKNSFPSFRLYKLKPEWVDFDIRIVVKELEHYINSEDAFTLYAPVSASLCYLNRERTIYSGISVYDSFANYINNIKDSEMINTPFAYGLMEFIMIMKYRIQYIFKFGGNLFPNSKKKEIINSFDNLIMQHSQLVNLCVRENMRFPRIGNRKNLAITSEQLKKDVLDLYKTLYDLLKDIDYRIIMNNNRFYYGAVGDTGNLLPKIL